MLVIVDRDTAKPLAAQDPKVAGARVVDADKAPIISDPSMKTSPEAERVEAVLSILKERPEATVVTSSDPDLLAKRVPRRVKVRVVIPTIPQGVSATPDAMRRSRGVPPPIAGSDAVLRTRRLRELALMKGWHVVTDFSSVDPTLDTAPVPTGAPAGPGPTSTQGLAQPVQPASLPPAPDATPFSPEGLVPLPDVPSVGGD